MFEAAELGRKVAKQEFDALAPALRVEIVEMQQALRGTDFPVIVVFAGVDGAGKSEGVNLVNEWMDPRWIVTRAYGSPSDEEAERPEFWRYWRDLPAKGRIGLFLSAWYTAPLLDRVYGRIGKARLDERLDRIAEFERTLADDGALILKFWMHLDKASQKKRLKKLQKDPLHHWKITKKDWDNWKRYDKFIGAAERIIMQTSTAKAQWKIVEGRDSQYRSLVVLTTIRDAVNAHMEERRARADLVKRRRRRRPRRAEEAPDEIGSAGVSILSRLDLTQAVGPDAYRRRLRGLHARLHGVYRKAKKEALTTILVFEGWDASGKGGSVRRLTSALDARDYRVLPFGAPTDEERAQHYLWRFWRQLPRAGRFTVFDRSWYGRVLVERVEGYASEEEWRRAYREINEFEAQLVDHGVVLMKYWLHIGKDEQERRFLARREIPYKRWKLTEEDWRNREKWDDYERAVNEMVERTSTVDAPWTLVEANDKRHARLKVIETLCDRLEHRLS
jgi:polyphosphate:AMP phosphotransferase